MTLRVVLVDVRRSGACTLKDVAGGFGTRFRVGNSLPARLLERAKARIASLPHVTLAYLDAMFTARGADVTIVESDGTSALPAADLVLIASSIVESAHERELAAMARSTGARVGVYGAFAAEMPEFYADAVDFVVRGEIEALVDRLAARDDLRGVVDAGFVPDLDALPFPSWSKFDVARSRYAIVASDRITLPLLASRGCAYRCDYCPYLVNAKYRTRSVDSFVAEIATQRDRHGATAFSFRDPLRLFDADEARRFHELLQERGLDIRFSMECRADRLDAPLLRSLHRAGLRCLEIGVESADPRTVADRERRPPALAHVELVVRECDRLGIRVIANFLLGLPNDTEDGMLATAKYARRLNTFAVQFTVATPYPGTALHREVKDRIVEPNWEAFDGWTNVFRHPTLSAERIHALREQAYVRYHFRPRYLAKFMRSVLAARS